MQPRKPDDSINLEDSGTLDLGRLLTRPQVPEDQTADIPEFSRTARQGDSKSRELLANPFDIPEKG
jgi:hypothetical protein